MRTEIDWKDRRQEDRDTGRRAGNARLVDDVK